jgi:hypothetical protein
LYVFSEKDGMPWEDLLRPGPAAHHRPAQPVMAPILARGEVPAEYEPVRNIE